MDDEQVRQLMAEWGRRGGQARAKNLGKAGMSEIGKAGAAARWGKKKKKKKPT